MSDDMGWRARIDTLAGIPEGAGFLVAPDKVLTCAHVVDGMSAVRVTFPNAGDWGTLATVTCRGPWRRKGDRGDVALLELESPAPIRPCRFAALDALSPGAGTQDCRLRALGFPDGHLANGIHATLRTSADQDLGHEWLQVGVEEAHLQRLDFGFSGAGVYLPATGEVVGLVTGVVLGSGGGGYVGTMLPLTTIRRYWEGLDDLLPYAFLDQPSRAELRAAVAGASLTADLDKIFRMTFWPHLREDLATPWAAIRYVGECMRAEEGLRDFLVKLAFYLEPGPRARLGRWMRRWKPDWADELTQARSPVTSVVVTARARRESKYMELGVRPLVNGVWTEREEIVRVRRDRFQSSVERLVADQVNRLDTANLMIEFAVEKECLGLSFDEWHFQERGVRGPRRMGSLPLIVWYVARLDPANRASLLARERWQLLRENGRTELEPVDCGLAYGYEEFRDWLDDAEDVCALAYAATPKPDWIEAAVDTGIPVMVWHRDACSAGCGPSSHGTFFTWIRGRLAVPPDQLPAEVMRLRKRAWSPARDDTAEQGRHLTLIWDDPARLRLLSDPPLRMGG